MSILKKGRKKENFVKNHDVEYEKISFSKEFEVNNIFSCHAQLVIYIRHSFFITYKNKNKHFRIRGISSVVPDSNLKDFNVVNEPILGYKKGSKEREELIAALNDAKSNVVDVPIMIGGEEFRTNDVRYQVMPHNHQAQIARFYYADEKLVQKAICSSTEMQQKWDKTPLKERVEIWERAANLMAGKYRQKLNASTMLGQSKTAIQAEIDAAAELVDFFRFNLFFLKENAKYQPISEDIKVTKNSVRFRGFDGFIAAVSPFNFTAIGGNLSYTPALMGNSVLWKPSDTAILSNWTIYEIMREAGNLLSYHLLKSTKIFIDKFLHYQYYKYRPSRRCCQFYSNRWASFWRHNNKIALSSWN